MNISQAEVRLTETHEQSVCVRERETVPDLIRHLSVLCPKYLFCVASVCQLCYDLGFLNLKKFLLGWMFVGKFWFFFFCLFILLNKNGRWQLSLWWRLDWRSLCLWSVLWCRDCPMRGFVFFPSPVSWDPVTEVDPRSFLLQLQKWMNTCLKL